jgi:hypothetical protein
MVMIAYLDVAKFLEAMIFGGAAASGCTREISKLSSVSARGSEGAEEGPVPQIATLRWALRRAAWGLLMLAAAVTLGAWLLYASIDPDDAAAGDASEPIAAGTARN